MVTSNYRKHLVFDKRCFLKDCEYLPCIYKRFSNGNQYKNFYGKRCFFSSANYKKLMQEKLLYSVTQNTLNYLGFSADIKISLKYVGKVFIYYLAYLLNSLLLNFMAP